MAAIIGWIIICTGLCLVSGAVLWPAYRHARQRFPELRHARWAYAAATAGCSIALWYAIPLLTWAVFGRSAH
jgi:hypothetical protein